MDVYQCYPVVLAVNPTMISMTKYPYRYSSDACILEGTKICLVELNQEENHAWYQISKVIYHRVEPSTATLVDQQNP